MGVSNPNVDESTLFLTLPLGKGSIKKAKKNMDLSILGWVRFQDGDNIHKKNGRWRQWGTSMVGVNDGSSGWLSEKYFPNELKSPKTTFCFIHIWGVGGCFRPKYGYIHIFF